MLTKMAEDFFFFFKYQVFVNGFNIINNIVSDDLSSLQFFKFLITGKKNENIFSKIPSITGTLVTSS